MAEITAQQKDLITELKAKLQFAENQLADEQNKKATEIETANQDYKDALAAIEVSYAAKIDSLISDIATLTAQIEEVK